MIPGLCICRESISKKPTKKSSNLLFTAAFAIISFILNITLIGTSSAAVSDCVLDAPKEQVVSLGKPVALERLANKTKVRIGVLPFYFSDGPIKQLSAAQKAKYEAAAKLIMDLSSTSVKIEMVFLNSFNTGKPASSLKQAYLDRQRSYGNDINKGTWGFVRETIRAADKTTDFTNLDSVILESNNVDTTYWIAEAMQFFRGTNGNVFYGAGSDFYRSIETEEGFIDNAILLDKPREVGTIAHEIFHNFGLTDLYGGIGPQVLSIMDDEGTSNILSYEKAVLGWLPENQVQCLSMSDLEDKSVSDSIITFNDVRLDQVFILENDSQYLILEVGSYFGEPLLTFYEIRTRERPPLIFFSKQEKGMWFENYSFFPSIDLGKEFLISNLVFIISSIEGNTVTLNVTRSSNRDSVDYKNLQSDLLNKRNDLIAIEQNRVQKAKKSIICLKGSVKKKITAIKPKCPKGYKKK